MSNTIAFLQNKATEDEIVGHLAKCDTNFIPQLSLRVELNEYGAKLFNNAIRFEAWSEEKLVGLIAVYCNDLKCRTAYITSVSVLVDFMGQGIASRLMSECVRHIKLLGFQRLELEVDFNNMNAIRLYEQKEFVADQVNGSYITMLLDINKES